MLACSVAYRYGDEYFWCVGNISAKIRYRYFPWDPLISVMRKIVPLVFLTNVQFKEEDELYWYFYKQVLYRSSAVS